jgi:hypothetical protein
MLRYKVVEITIISLNNQSWQIFAGTGQALSACHAFF